MKANPSSAAVGCAFSVLGGCLVLVLAAIWTSGVDTSARLLFTAMALAFAGVVAVSMFAEVGR